MFYSSQILARKGPLGLMWMAAHMDRGLKRNQPVGNSLEEGPPEPCGEPQVDPEAEARHAAIVARWHRAYGLVVELARLGFGGEPGAFIEVDLRGGKTLPPQVERKLRRDFRGRVEVQVVDYCLTKAEGFSWDLVKALASRFSLPPLLLSDLLAVENTENFLPGSRADAPPLQPHPQGSRAAPGGVGGHRIHAHNHSLRRSSQPAANSGTAQHLAHHHNHGSMTNHNNGSTLSGLARWSQLCSGLDLLVPSPCHWAPALPPCLAPTWA
ncbi:hypothetical protein TSOC_001460 [Tetrabaena socialis]|uniref:Rad21/Rec8-like protein N-terminal domain-containing protein n=1 Tax=Tetrabaena socialis TaxID=47790 RepID=A0A2J8AGQ4_9CHLO|nr:hypothetical protein TSOC_001460 [Tetrabaena socialis]|eukprot:PNH11694.1 hypothetical protein TSOC_001460 [Tetrabaena socialis]